MDAVVNSCIGMAISGRAYLCRIGGNGTDLAIALPWLLSPEWLPCCRSGRDNIEWQFNFTSGKRRKFAREMMAACGMVPSPATKSVILISDMFGERHASLAVFKVSMYIAFVAWIDHNVTMDRFGRTLGPRAAKCAFDIRTGMLCGEVEVVILADGNVADFESSFKRKIMEVPYTFYTPLESVKVTAI
jgi:hypothetical protein